MGKNGKVLQDVDRQGGLFTPIPGKPLRVVYQIGPHQKEGAAPNPNVLLQCPVSAIPDPVWDLLTLWYQCRLTRTMPKGGGFLDQPLMVRRSFPVFEAEMVAWEAANGGPQRTAALAVGAVMAALSRG